MIQHSYKTIKYQCEKCNYFGVNNETMEVHIGKGHSETFECGMCDLALQNLESLETHLKTCEMCECSKCCDKFKTLLDIKKHIREDHSTEENGKPYKHLQVYHTKQNRTHRDQVHRKIHFIADLFPDLVNQN
jgi:hypothetical protein